MNFYRGGAGPRGVLATLSQYMLSSAATFGFFLSIGSVSTYKPLVSSSYILVLPGHSERRTTRMGSRPTTTYGSYNAIQNGRYRYNESTLGGREEKDRISLSRQSTEFSTPNTLTQHSTKADDHYWSYTPHPMVNA